MVIVLPRANRSPSTSSLFAQAIGSAISSGLKSYGERRKQKEQDESLQQSLSTVEQLYSDPNLSSEQKQIGLFKALRSQPELAKTLGQQLAGMGQKLPSKYEQFQMDQMRDEENFLSRLMGNGGRQGIDDFSHMSQDNSYGSSRMEGEEATGSEFDYRDPSTWTDKQINQFRSIKSKSPKAQTLANMAQNEFENRQESKKTKEKYQENIGPLEAALDTLSVMEKLGSRGNLGIGTSVRGILSPQARRDRGEYERLGKSLIQYSTNIPIRNRSEFETLAHDLYDASISDDARVGILSAMKRIIQNSMPQYQRQRPQEIGGEEIQNKANRPPLTGFLMR